MKLLISSFTFSRLWSFSCSSMRISCCSRLTFSASSRFFSSKSCCFFISAFCRWCTRSCIKWFTSSFRRRADSSASSFQMALWCASSAASSFIRSFSRFFCSSRRATWASRYCFCSAFICCLRCFCISSIRSCSFCSSWIFLDQGSCSVFTTIRRCTRGGRDRTSWASLETSLKDPTFDMVSWSWAFEPGYVPAKAAWSSWV
mmetsp:Transcript_22431/g.38250  ORF Transcript_22431/g.38250 Transcript_22431/m.38250 type:complete len:202 (-) Transcript_22431:393-998(-)